jgi:hypothetical protein
MPDLTKVDWNGNNDPTVDPSLWRPMDRVVKAEGPVWSEAENRKRHPMVTGLLDYFPDALYEVAGVSKKGNDQHNPGQPLHWAKEKSTDHPDALLRHLKDRGTRDTDGERHSAKVAWRALALLQMEIEAERRTPLTITSHETTFEPVK